MQDQAREANTRCPRCALPIVWAARPVHDSVRLELLAILCRCPLADEERDDLAAQLAAALAARGLADALPKPFDLEELLRRATALPGD